MNRRYMTVLAVCAALALMLATAGQVAAQQAAKGNTVEYKGRVTAVSKEASTISIQSGTQVVQVKYTDQTQFTYRNKPGKLDDVKEGRRVIVLVDATQKDKMIAKRVDVREGK